MSAGSQSAAASAPRRAGSVQPRTGATSAPQTGAQAVIADATDPARRPDVLLRKRRPEGELVSPWWMIGAFVAVSGAVILLLSLMPGGA